MSGSLTHLSPVCTVIIGTVVIYFSICVNAEISSNRSNKNVEPEAVEPEIVETESAEPVKRGESNTTKIESRRNVVAFNNMSNNRKFYDLLAVEKITKPCTVLLQVINIPAGTPGKENEIVSSILNNPWAPMNNIGNFESLILDNIITWVNIISQKYNNNNIRVPWGNRPFLPHYQVPYQSTPSYPYDHFPDSLTNNGHLNLPWNEENLQCRRSKCKLKKLLPYLLFDDYKGVSSKYPNTPINYPNIRHEKLPSNNHFPLYPSHDKHFSNDVMVWNWFISYFRQLNPSHNSYNLVSIYQLFSKYLNIIKLIFAGNYNPSWNKYKSQIYKWFVYCKSHKCWQNYTPKFPPYMNNFPPYPQNNYSPNIPPFQNLFPMYSLNNSKGNIIKTIIHFYRYIYKFILTQLDNENSIIHSLPNFKTRFLQIFLKYILKYHKSLVHQLSTLEMLYPGMFTQYENIFARHYLKLLDFLLMSYKSTTTFHKNESFQSTSLSNQKMINFNSTQQFTEPKDSFPNLVMVTESIPNDIITTTSTRDIPDSESQPVIKFNSSIFWNNSYSSPKNVPFNLDILDELPTSTASNHIQDIENYEIDESLSVMPNTSESLQEDHTHSLNVIGSNSYNVNHVNKIEIEIEFPQTDVEGTELEKQNTNNTNIRDLNNISIYDSPKFGDNNNFINQSDISPEMFEINAENNELTMPGVASRDVQTHEIVESKDLSPTTVTEEPINVDAEFLEYVCPEGYYYDFNEDTCISVVPPLPVQLKLTNSTDTVQALNETTHII